MRKGVASIEAAPCHGTSRIANPLVSLKPYTLPLVRMPCSPLVVA